jgi:hypothetical protein
VKTSNQFRRMARSRVDDAHKDSAGLQIIRRRIGPAMRDREEAEAWAAQQPWAGRVVRMLRARGFYCWCVRP